MALCRRLLDSGYVLGDIHARGTQQTFRVSDPRTLRGSVVERAIITTSMRRIEDATPGPPATQEEKERGRRACYEAEPPIFFRISPSSGQLLSLRFNCL